MTDIIIGARKHRPRPSRRLLVFAIAAVLLYLVVRFAIGWLIAFPNPDVSISRDPLQFSNGDDGGRLTLGAATLERDPLPILRASGKPVTLGGAAGRMLGDAIAASSQRLSAAARKSQRGGDLVARLFGRERGDWKLRHVDDGVPGHQLVEVAALAAGARAADHRCSYDDLVRAQASYDLAPPDARSGGHALKATTRALTIVGPLAGASGERLVMGRVFSTPGIGGGEVAANAVRIYRPDDVLAFAAVGDPAQVGVVTGINAAGLVVAVHPLRTGDSPTSEKAQPSPLIARDVLENARSVEQAVSILEAATPLGSAIYVLADASSEAPVVVERTPRRFGIREEAPTHVVIDLLESGELADEPESERNRRIRPAPARAARAHALLKERPPRSPGDIAQLLRDRHGADGPLPAGHRATIDDPSAAHAVIIDPAALVLWVNVGPGTSGHFTALDLRHELRGEGKRPAPPPDISADTKGLPQARAVVEAREHLTAARAARGRGATRQARELAARALLAAPDLPEALLVAADIEARAGNDAVARELYKRLLTLGVDVPSKQGHVEDGAR